MSKADFSALGFEDDLKFCRHLTTEVGVAAIPPTALTASRVTSTPIPSPGTTAYLRCIACPSTAPPPGTVARRPAEPFVTALSGEELHSIAALVRERTGLTVSTFGAPGDVSAGS